MNNLSVSQIKKFMKSPSQWAGEYILGIKDEYKEDALHIGSAFHKYCETKSHDKSEDYLSLCEDQATSREQYNTLCANFDRFKDMNRGEAEVKVEVDLWGVPFIGYIDDLSDWVTDYKSVSSLSKREDKPAMWQAQNNYDEYMLQAYVYMKATNRSKARFIEVMKKVLKKRPDEFGQIIEFELTQEMEDYMKERYEPIVKQMVELYQKHI